MPVRFARALHPGEFLREEYLKPLGMSAEQLARALDLPLAQVEQSVGERAGVSSALALRLATYFKTTPDFWLNPQQAYELESGGL